MGESVVFGVLGRAERFSFVGKFQVTSGKTLR